ncbi:hypothetical protein FHU41_000106 [Psychromicrobium silvestre]|uniref:Uncharacterized protein n=1 Tax=Psychromicrobium silvestre TaxID=1645614 RepID=A0A7Y9LQS9_9MICC|nr:hypothetical protein [Psychromicrobium silvestre]
MCTHLITLAAFITTQIKNTTFGYSVKTLTGRISARSFRASPIQGVR